MKAEEIAKEIFYLPATNDKANGSIEHGAKLINDFAKQQAKEFAEWIRENAAYYGSDTFGLDDEVIIICSNPYETEYPNLYTTDELYKIWKEEQSHE
jgi:hypothetical protein